MRFGIRLMRNLSAETRVFESFFHRVFSNFEGEHAMSEVLVTGFFMDSLQSLLQSLEFGPKRLQLILLSFFQLRHAWEFLLCLFGCQLPPLIGDRRGTGSNDVNEFKTGFSVTSVARAQSLVVGLLELGCAFALYGFIQFSNLRLKH